MKITGRKKKRGQAQAAASDKQRKTIRFEWPLLAFPIMALIALAILYAVNHSLERRISNGPSSTQPGSKARVHDNRELPAVTNETSAANEGRNVPVPPSRRALLRTDPSKDRLPDADRAADGTAANEVQAKGVAGAIAALREAVEKGDQTALKRHLKEIVAMGDEAIEPLLELVAEGDGEVGLWAAEALARIGTPVAAGALLDVLALTEEGQYKEELAKRVSAITNHDSWPVLLDTVLETDDPTLIRAAGASLSKMADSPILDEIVARYEAATDEREAQRLAQLVSSISSPQATEALLSLSGDVSHSVENSLQKAAVAALGKIGSPQGVSYLLRKLEASPPGEGGYLFNTITQITSQQAHASLLYAAAGNKEVSAESGRTAAIYALKNFPDGQTCALLESIIEQEDNTAVATAAVRTLERIQQAAPQATAKADPTVTIPKAPLQK